MNSGGDRGGAAAGVKAAMTAVHSSGPPPASVYVQDPVTPSAPVADTIRYSMVHAEPAPSVNPTASVRLAPGVFVPKAPSSHAIPMTAVSATVVVADPVFHAAVGNVG